MVFKFIKQKNKKIRIKSRQKRKYETKINYIIFNIKLTI